MHEHANCLEQVLTILMDCNDLLNICPFSSLLNITPINDDFFDYVKHCHKKLNHSERVDANSKPLSKPSLGE